MPKQNKIFNWIKYIAGISLAVYGMSFLPDLFRGILIFLGGLLIAIETYDQ
jgi:hypothetical protein